MNAALSGFKSDLLALPAERLEQWLAGSPELAGYRRFLAQIRSEQAHQLGPDAERVVGAFTELTQSPFTVWQNTVNADITFDPVRDENGQLVPMSFGALGRFYQSPQRTIRKAAFDSINAGFARHKHTLAALLATAVKRDVTLAKLRRYPSALAAALEPVGLPAAALRNLVETAVAGSRHLRRYMAFRSRALGLPQLASYDMSIPLDSDVTLSLTPAEGLALVQAAMAPLGPEYGELLRRAQRERWIDWANNRGKSLVPFSRGCYG